MIPIAKPALGEPEATAARRVILSGWVTQGPEVKAFEQEFAAFVDAKHACAVSNCTTALHLALRAVGVGAGDEVVTVSHSFIATANSILYCGAIPVFVDIDPGTFNIVPELIAPLITGRTRAILCVHQMGMPCDLAAILEVGQKHGIPVVEDAACAVGSEILWGRQLEKIGKPHGDVACFSFHPRKLLTTGDGGMLTTSRAELDARFRRWRQHAMSIPDSVRHSSSQVAFEEYTELGYNYRMTDIQAAVGREQLRKLPTLLSRRRAQVATYRELLADVPGLVLPVEPAWARSNWQSFCVRLPEGVEQLEVMQRLLDSGIATRRGVMCAHRELAFRTNAWSCGVAHSECGCRADHCARLRVSEEAQERTILLPLFHELRDDQQVRICAELRAAARHAVP
jgi:dTDP-4-amino-4,6-dideoxygalactose transaminase